jgi:hypothetical protein
MSRRSTPERIFAARRAALKYGLMDYGMPLETSEAWCDAWQDEADRRGGDRRSSGYWDGAADWIAAQRMTRKLPA